VHQDHVQQGRCAGQDATHRHANDGAKGAAHAKHEAQSASTPAAALTPNVRRRCMRQGKGRRKRKGKGKGKAMLR
jgi:hypothetical protein